MAVNTSLQKRTYTSLNIGGIPNITMPQVPANGFHVIDQASTTFQFKKKRNFVHPEIHSKFPA